MARIGEHAGVPRASMGGLLAAAATPMTQPHIEQRGEGPRVLFVHGSVASGSMTWKAQYPLADRWTLLVLDRRGFGESPPADRDDFEDDARDIAEALGDGAHLVAHSYGGVGALLAAAARPQAVHSLTLVEPAAYSVAVDQEHVRRTVDQVAAYFAAALRVRASSSKVSANSWEFRQSCLIPFLPRSTHRPAFSCDAAYPGPPNSLSLISPRLNFAACWSQVGTRRCSNQSAMGWPLAWEPSDPLSKEPGILYLGLACHSMRSWRLSCSLAPPPTPTK